MSAHRRRRAPAAAIVAGLLCGAACCPAGDVAVRVVAADGATVRLSVCAAVAATEAARQKGLAGHAPLAGDEGLLLPFPSAGQVCLANGEVGFPIDAVYVDDTGAVVATASFAAGDPTQVCHDGVRRVLEVARGVAAAVAPGDHLDPPAAGG